jgi:hypothetical protein
LQQYGTSGRYASALYVAAAKANVLAAVEGEVQQVRGARERAIERARRDGGTRDERGLKLTCIACCVVLCR